MTRAATNMATIRDLKLELIDHDLKSHAATVRVSYEVHLTRLEQCLKNLRFKEDIQLCGAFSLDPEDFLYQLAERTFSAEHNGVVQRERIVTVDDGILEDDGIPQPAGELYAKVWVTPLLPQGDTKESRPVSYAH